jgi:hypothetical protein
MTPQQHQYEKRCDKFNTESSVCVFCLKYPDSVECVYHPDPKRRLPGFRTPSSSKPHPQRCETCNKPIGKPGGSDDCPIGIPSHLDVPEAIIIGEIGCASHSSAERMITDSQLHDILDRNCKHPIATRHHPSSEK